MRSRLELELQDASEQEAALAVLQSLYAVKPLPELLSELSHEQQLQAAVLADKWQVPHVSSAAAQLLAAAAKTPGALAEAVLQRVMQDPALPDCLQPLLESALLSSLGDLEAVWADVGLRDQLLALSLPAMELLLSCDELKVRGQAAPNIAAATALIKAVRELAGRPAASLVCVTVPSMSTGTCARYLSLVQTVILLLLLLLLHGSGIEHPVGSQRGSWL
jgi:hypothetical protein